MDMQVVKERLKKGALVGAGSFASGFAASAIEEQVGTGNIGTAGGQIALGLGASVAADELFGRRQSVPNDVVEYVGYGVQGAGFANLADAVRMQAQNSQTGRVVNVQSNTGRRNRQASEAPSEDADVTATINA